MAEGRTGICHAGMKQIPTKRPVEQYEHKDKKRWNKLLVGLVAASCDAIEGKQMIYFDPPYGIKGRRAD
ncbi:MAG: hypothetical protein L0Z68_10750 [Gammaproteobacteria bacterium]|nr:hypothetical protein [Gammaproteobacteria bacterium]